MDTRKIFFIFITLWIIVCLLPASDYQIQIIENEESLPHGFRSIGQKGDYLLSDGTVMALVGGSERLVRKHSYYYPLTNALGTILGIQPIDVTDQRTFIAGTPLIKTSDRYTYLAYDSVEHRFSPDDGCILFTAAARLLSGKQVSAEIKTVYRFIPGENKVKILSTIKNVDQIPLEGIDYSLHFRANHSYFFKPFNSTTGSIPDVWIFPKETHAMAWTGRRPLRSDEDLVPGVIAPGDVFMAEYVLYTHPSFEGLMSQVFHSFGLETEQVSIHLEGMSDSQAEVIVQDPVSDAVFFRSFLEEESVEIPLPEGVFSVRANFFPAVVEETIAVESGCENICHLENPPGGEVHLHVRDSNGLFIPAKVSFIGLDPTRSPYFKPENPMKTGKSWEDFKNSCFPPKEGLSLHLPAGSYLVTASRGPEYSSDHEVIEVLDASIHLIEFELQHILDTPRLVSLDPHMHTFWSDGDMDIPDRLRSVIAEGIDVAVASDHNILIEYAPALQELGLDKYLAVLVGNEITQNDLLHYNTYPLSIKRDKDYNGAIYPALKTAGGLFESSRTNDPSCLIQVNHPRSAHQGYFHTQRLDLESAAFASIGFDMSFDLIEVMNGPSFARSNYATVQDWLHLLDRGYFFPAIGSSDSHSIDKDEPGYSRTYLIFEEEQTGPPPIPEMMERLKKGHSFISNGPLIDMRIDDRFIPGDLLTPASSSIQIALEVRAAPWISVDEVRLIINGKRGIVFPVESNRDSLLKFSKKIELSPEKDIYVAAEAIGKISMFPVLQRTAILGDPEQASLPYALTNPVFVDADGNGRFDPPLTEKIRLLDNLPPQEKIKR